MLYLNLEVEYGELNKCVQKAIARSEAECGEAKSEIITDAVLALLTEKHRVYCDKVAACLKETLSMSRNLR